MESTGPLIVEKLFETDWPTFIMFILLVFGEIMFTLKCITITFYIFFERTLMNDVPKNPPGDFILLFVMVFNHTMFILSAVRDLLDDKCIFEWPIVVILALIYLTFAFLFFESKENNIKHKEKTTTQNVDESVPSPDSGDHAKKE